MIHYTHFNTEVTEVCLKTFTYQAELVLKESATYSVKTTAALTVNRHKQQVFIPVDSLMITYSAAPLAFLSGITS